MAGTCGDGAASGLGLDDPRLPGGAIMSLSTLPAAQSYEPILVVHRGVLYQIQIWSHREWVDVPPGRRPRIAEYAPSIGWIVGVPIEYLN
jgi:hypothetical protein